MCHIITLSPLDPSSKDNGIARTFISNFTEIVGIREGTVIGALIVGPMTQFALRYLGSIKAFCGGHHA